jgi:predicted nuclease of restriction endonuclease-like (RecB) superfamily
MPLYELNESVSSPIEVLPSQREASYLDQLVKKKMQEDLFSNNQYEQIIKQRTKDEFLGYLKYKEKITEIETLRDLENKGIISVNWRSYNGTASSEEQRMDEIAERVLKIGLGFAFIVGAIMAIL